MAPNERIPDYRQRFGADLGQGCGERSQNAQNEIGLPARWLAGFFATIFVLHAIVAFGQEIESQVSSQELLPRDPPQTPQTEDAERRMRELDERIRRQKLEREKLLLESDRLRPPATAPEVITSPAPVVREATPTPEGDSRSMGEALLLADVIASTYRAYPEIEIARLQSGVARGEITNSLGAYDLNLEYYSLNRPIGAYENFRNGVGVARQLWWGGYAMAGYRIGRGDFEPWYKERETDKGGEFTVGFIQPLLQGRAIDPFRVALFQANLDQAAVQPEIQFNVLWTSLDAAYAYWSWVEAGNVLKSQEELLNLAIQRNDILLKLFDRGWSSRNELSINAQTISERQLKVFEAQQKFRNAAIKLAIFLRDDSGAPMLAAPEWLPAGFPVVEQLPQINFDADFEAAQQRRPELQLIAIDVQRLRWDLELARNQLLPTFDAQLRTFKNVGDVASRFDDKEETMVETGFEGGVPIQRRKARGKIDSTLAKMQQIEQKRIFQINKIEVELRRGANDLEFSKKMVDRSAQLVRETRETLEYFRRDFAAGNRDFLFLLQQEAKVTESEIKLLDAEREYFMSLAKLQATLGLDPLEQALNIKQDEVLGVIPSNPPRP
ncbi:MAG: TolC family protein [Planctomycetes bacterium]|nr:TolC family protein [Planctomycetota bacterium]